MLASANHPNDNWRNVYSVNQEFLEYRSSILPHVFHLDFNNCHNVYASMLQEISELGTKKLHFAWDFHIMWGVYGYNSNNLLPTWDSVNGWDIDMCCNYSDYSLCFDNQKRLYMARINDMGIFISVFPVFLLLVLCVFLKSSDVDYL